MDVVCNATEKATRTYKKSQFQNVIQNEKWDQKFFGDMSFQSDSDEMLKLYLVEVDHAVFSEDSGAPRNIFQ